MNITPIHQSRRKALKAGARINPIDMESTTVSHEDFELVQQIAMDVYADMCNAGYPMQEALAAVYVSGLQHGSQVK